MRTLAHARAYIGDSAILSFDQMTIVEHSSTGPKYMIEHVREDIDSAMGAGTFDRWRKSGTEDGHGPEYELRFPALVSVDVMAFRCLDWHWV